MNLKYGYYFRIDDNGLYYINKHYPYDEQEYHWAKMIENDNGISLWKIIRDGKVIKIFEGDIDAVVERLYLLNKELPSKICH